jgi:hypothetical protein
MSQDGYGPNGSFPHQPGRRLLQEVERGGRPVVVGRPEQDEGEELRGAEFACGRQIAFESATVRVG